MPLSQKELDQIKDVIQDGQKETVAAVREMFVSVGIDIENPIKMQKQMTFLSQISALSDSIVSKVVIGAVTIFGATAVLIASYCKVKGQ